MVSRSPYDRKQFRIGCRLCHKRLQMEIKTKDRTKEKAKTLKLCLVIAIQLVSPCVVVVIWVWRQLECWFRGFFFFISLSSFFIHVMNSVAFYLALRTPQKRTLFQSTGLCEFGKLSIAHGQLNWNHIILLFAWNSMAVIQHYRNLFWNKIDEYLFLGCCWFDRISTTKKKKQEEKTTETHKDTIDFMFIRLLSRWLYSFQSTYSNTLTAIACHFH